MQTEFFVTCPFCGETVQIYVEPDVTGTLVQDCEVCCQPWEVVVGPAEPPDLDRTVEVRKGDGSG